MTVAPGERVQLWLEYIQWRRRRYIAENVTKMHQASLLFNLCPNAKWSKPKPHVSLYVLNDQMRPVVLKEITVWTNVRWR